MRLRSCLVHGIEVVTQQGPQFARTGGLFPFVSRNVYQRRTAFARGDFAADGIAAKGSDDHVRVMAAALLEPFSFSTFQRLSCLLGCVLTAPCRNAMQDNWLAAGDQLKAATLAREFRLALVEVARQRLNNYRLTHLQEA
jgi:hypothetical protein